MGPRTLTYNGDARALVGEAVIGPRFHVGGGLTFVRWVATDAVYVSDTDKTYVEWDVSQESEES